MSSSCALSCWPSVKKQKQDFPYFAQCTIKQLFRFSFCDIQNNQGLGKGHQSHLQLWQIIPTSTLIILDITKTSYNNKIVYYYQQRDSTNVQQLDSDGGRISVWNGIFPLSDSLLEGLICGQCQLQYMQLFWAFTRVIKQGFWEKTCSF